jgi:hypothetical protein
MGGMCIMYTTCQLGSGMSLYTCRSSSRCIA